MTDSGKTILSISQLVKRFGSLTAVNGINLSVREGEIFGFLGPNGAGKTTTISMLTTLITPTSGTANVAGYDLQEEPTEVRAVIGVVPQTFSLFPELTPLENLSYVGKLYGMDRPTIRARSEELLKRVSLYDFKDKIAGVFSGGMKQRLSLAASILSRPKVLFMDEPTTGLDPQSRIAMRNLTRELNGQGMTIIYTTHDMEEVEKLCDRIVIMDKGNIIADGTSEEIKALLPEDHLIEIEFEKPSPAMVPVLSRLPYVSKVSERDHFLDLSVAKTKGVVLSLSAVLQKEHAQVREIRVKEHTLEDVFIYLTKKDLRD